MRGLTVGQMAMQTYLIDAFTRDVYVYLTYPGVRAQIDKVVADALGNEPCVVVAHSLGTVVAYNVLRTRAATPQFPKLVTVGSPLGIRAIKQQLATPLVSPPCVGQWFNAYDDRDVVERPDNGLHPFPVGRAFLDGQVAALQANVRLGYPGAGRNFS